MALAGIPALRKNAQSVLPGLNVGMPGMPGQRAFLPMLLQNTPWGATPR
jgi:hypothetical protein